MDTQLGVLYDVTKFIATFDATDVQAKMFAKEGDMFIKQLIEQIERWRGEMDKCSSYQIGCCTLRY